MAFRYDQMPLIIIVFKLIYIENWFGIILMFAAAHVCPATCGISLIIRKITNNSSLHADKSESQQIPFIFFFILLLLIAKQNDNKSLCSIWSYENRMAEYNRCLKGQLSTDWNPLFCAALIRFNMWSGGLFCLLSLFKLICLVPYKYHQYIQSQNWNGFLNLSRASLA